jgi:hypothetical protein
VAVNAAAGRAMTATNEFQFEQAKPQAFPTLIDPASHVTVYPTGIKLPQSFYAAVDATMQPLCMQLATLKCVARIITLNPNTPVSVLFQSDGMSSADLYQQTVPGQWQRTAVTHTIEGCPFFNPDFRTSSITLIPHAFPDLVIDGHHVELEPLSPPDWCSQKGLR